MGYEYVVYDVTYATTTKSPLHKSWQRSWFLTPQRRGKFFFLITMAARGPNLYECATWHLNDGGTYEKHSKHVTKAPTYNMYFEISWRIVRMQFLDQDFGCDGQLGELHLNWGGGGGCYTCHQRLLLQVQQIIRTSIEWSYQFMLVLPTTFYHLLIQRWKHGKQVSSCSFLDWSKRYNKLG